MAIKPEERQVGTQPSNRLIREFKTQLPTPEMSGLTSLGKVIGDIGEREILKKEEADKERAGIEGLTVIKNDDGSYSRAIPPEGGSTAYRNAFNVASDQAYVNAVYRDFEYKANIIAADRTVAADNRIAKLQAHAAGTLSGVDPRVRGQLEPIFQREINQRQGSMLNLEASDNKSSLITQNASAAEDHLRKYLDLSSINATEEAKTAFSAARSSFEAAARLRNPSQAYVDQEMAGFDSRRQELDTFLPTLDKIRQGIANKTVAPDEIERFLSMLKPGAAAKGAVAFDMTDADVASTMSKDTRDYVRGLLDTLNKDYAAAIAQTTEDRKADELNIYFSNGGTSLPENIGANVHSAAARKILKGQNLNPETPEGLTALARLHNGILPEDLYRTRFSGIHEVDGATPEGRAKLEDRLALYRRLKQLPTTEGIQDRTDIISATERNFLYHVANAGGDNLDLAARTAKAMIDKGMAMSPQAQLDFVRQEIMVKNKNAKVDERFVVGETITQMARGQAGGSFFKPNYDELPMEARQYVVTEVAKSMVMGIPWEQAVKDAGRDFINNWTKSNIIVSNRPGGTNSPWVKKEEQVPLAYDALNQKQTDEYLKPYVDKYLKERINLDGMKASGVPVDKLEFGKNVKLMPNRLGGQERSYTLVYYEPNARGITTLFTKENTPALIVPNGARQEFQNATTAENVRQSLFKNQATTGAIVVNTIDNIAGNPAAPKGYIWRDSNQQAKVDFEAKMKNPDISVLEPAESYSVLLGRTRASVAPSAQKYIDFTSNKLSEYGMQDQAGYLIKTLGLESQFNPKAQNQKSTAYGLGQMTAGTWARYGQGDRNDPEAQIDAVIRFTRDNLRSFKSANGRDPSNGELYLMHQQGFGGASALLSNPDANAIDVLTKATGDRKLAVASIANNLPGDMSKFSGTITARQFTSFWMSKFR